MSDFDEFMNEIEESPAKLLPTSDITLSEIRSALTTNIAGLLSPFPISSDERQKFSEEVSSLVQNKAFLSEFSTQIGEPLEHESEDEFVKRGSDKLRQMLYQKFNIQP